MNTPAVPSLSKTLHATCVDVGGRGVLIMGASGTGKSGLALELMAYGAQLVADDQTIVTRLSGALVASCPPQIHGLIEARGIGLLRADAIARTQICLVVDLDQTETERLPPKRQRDILDVPIDLVFPATSRHFPFGVLQVLRANRMD